MHNAVIENLNEIFEQVLYILLEKCINHLHIGVVPIDNLEIVPETKKDTRSIGGSYINFVFVNYCSFYNT